MADVTELKRVDDLGLMDVKPLFRDQALAARFTKPGSAIILAMPLSVRGGVLLGFFILFAVLLFGFLCKVRPSIVVGCLLTQDISTVNVVVPFDARIDHTYVNRGDIVEKGQLLYMVNTDKSVEENPVNARRPPNIDGLPADNHSLGAGIFPAGQLAEFADHLSVLNNKIGADVDILRRRRALKRPGNYNPAKRNIMVPELDLDITVFSDIEVLQKNLGHIIQSLNKAGQTPSAPPNFSSLESDLPLLVARLDAASKPEKTGSPLHRFEASINSPVSGLVISESGSNGSNLGAGSVLAQLSPVQDDREAKLVLTGPQRGLLRRGMRVQVRYRDKDGDTRAWESEIRSIEEGVINLSEAQRASVHIARGEAVYAVSISFPEGALPLQKINGDKDDLTMPRQARVYLESVSIFRWLFGHYANALGNPLGKR